MNWYYESAGQQQGPVNETDLDRLLVEGKITLDTLVWRDGLSGWTPLRTARPEVSTPPMSGMEVSMGSPLTPSATAGSDVPQPGWVRCSLTGRYFPPSEIIYIEGKPYCAAAKPQVVAAMQSGGVLPTFDTGRDGPDWEKRNQLGFVNAIIGTIKAVITQPQATFSTMKREGGLGAPLMYYLILGTTVGIITQVMTVMLQVWGIGAAANASARGTAFIVGQLVGGIIMAPIQVVIGAFLGAGILHLCLMLLKGANQPFETTFRALSYLYGSLAPANLIMVVAFIFAGFGNAAAMRGQNFGMAGIVLGLIMVPLVIWYFYLAMVAMSAAHETSRGKAAGAMLLPGVACCGVILVIAIVAGGFAAANR